MPTEDNEITIMLIGGSIAFLVLVVVLIFIILFYQKKKFTHAQQLLEAEKQHTEALLQSQIEIQEETFKNISQEIHDNIGQVLSLVKLNLNTLSPPAAEADKEKLSASVTLLTKSIKDLRDVAKSINTDYVAQIGLASAIRQQLDLLNKTGVFEASLEEEGKVVSLEKRNELIVFRVVQELLNNAIKHAAATKVFVRLFYTPAGLRLQVQDNGKGFDAPALNLTTNIPGGLGLSNMQNRISLLNGSMKINSTPGQGTTIHIELPCSEYPFT